jgi:large subunit ribosomal protein L17
MRHGVFGRRLNRQKDARTALRKVLVNQLFKHERIQTTEAKAKAIRGQAERLITLAKHGNAAGESRMVAARRLAVARLGDPEMVKKLFDDIAPRYTSRNGGYTRILKLGMRKGDAAKMALIELVEG